MKSKEGILKYPNHTWNRLEDEVFLRRIVGADGSVGPELLYTNNEVINKLEKIDGR